VELGSEEGGLVAYSDYFDAFLREVLSCGLGGIASDAADLEFLHERAVGEEVCDDGSALVACGAEDCDDLRHSRRNVLTVGCVIEVIIDVM
jgi:hypothetical protein